MPVHGQSASAVVEWLDGRDPDVARVGGKAASLDRLASFGFRIPPGSASRPQPSRSTSPRCPAPTAWAEDPGILGDVALRTALVDAMQSGPLTPAVGAGLAESLQHLASDLATDPAHPLRLAVRSSGVAEDGAAASFAGLHDTELDLTADEVPAAILRCWASLWSDRAIGHRIRRGLPLDGGGLAVVVQALVRPWPRRSP